MTYAFNWTAPVTSTFLMEIAINCDVPYYSSISSDARDKQCSAAFDMTVTAETRETVVKDTSIVARNQDACVLEAGSACQATFISQYERQQHAYLMYVTSVSEVDAPHAGDLVDVLVDVRVQATDDEDGMSALKSLTPSGIGCGHRRMADGADSVRSGGGGNSLTMDDAERVSVSSEPTVETQQALQIRALEKEVERLAEELRQCKAETGNDVEMRSKLVQKVVAQAKVAGGAA
eukprot:COSAG02_NODE_5638_length_4164_cov_5.215498_2_plen_234_part_00